MYRVSECSGVASAIHDLRSPSFPLDNLTEGGRMKLKTGMFISWSGDPYDYRRYPPQFGTVTKSGKVRLEGTHTEVDLSHRDDLRLVC